MPSPLSLLLGAFPFLVQSPEGPKAMLDWERPVACVTLAPTKAVPSGEFRVQCDLGRHVCLAAPTRVLVDGVEGDEPVSRVRDFCPEVLDRLELRHLDPQEWRFEEAIAETPPGWFRDERGRVMQVNFDLHRRVFLGGAWAPYYRPDGTSFVPGRARVEVGAEATNYTPDRMLRWHFLEASVWLGGQPRDLRVEASVVRFDLSARYARAPLWITTFIGEPRRLDLPLNFGFWAEAGRFEHLGGKTLMTVVEADATLDVWRSPDLDSFVRLRVGPALEYDADARGVALRPTAVLEGDVTVDRDGFHHLTAAVAGEKLFFEPRLEGRGANPQRLRLRAGYEVILLAINDYPLTLAVDARGTWRDDLPALKGWDWSLNAGLRFSFWAPARHSSLPVRARKVSWVPERVANPVMAPQPVPSPDPSPDAAP